MATRKRPSKQDQERAQRIAENEPVLSRKARVRIGELLAEFEPTNLVAGSILYQVRGRYSSPRIESFGEAAPRILRREFGQEIDVVPSKLRDFCLKAEVVDTLGDHGLRLVRPRARGCALHSRWGVSGVRG